MAFLIADSSFLAMLRAWPPTRGSRSTAPKLPARRRVRRGFAWMLVRYCASAPTDAVKVARRREAERRGDRGRGMARPEGVERALVALEEAGDASMLPDP